MATQSPKTMNLLFLDEIVLQGVPKLDYTLRLFVEDWKRKLQTQDNQTWSPVAQRPDVSPTSKVLVEIQMKSSLPWAKGEHTSKVIDLQKLFDIYWTSKEHELTLTEVVDVGGHRFSVEFRFSANSTAGSLRSSLKELEGLLEKYSPMINGPMERVVDRIIKYGVAFAELNPVAKAVFGLASVTFELLKEQNKYNQMPSALLDQLQRILPLAEKVAEEIVCEETEILEDIIPRMFEVMAMVSKFSCHYVRRARMVGGLIYAETIEEMDRELSKVIEDFDRALDVEALRLAKKTEQDLLLGQLKSVETGYDLNGRCMEGTRQSILNRIMAWATDPQERNDAPRKNTYWFYGSPGIGKTSLAHSICERLHDRKHLAGAFFCRRDDPDLSEPRNILPTLITKLARILPPFRRIVADRLRNDPNLTSKSMKHTLFLEFIRDLPREPMHALVFVIDALDECGDDRSRAAFLKVLTDLAVHAPWLKIIITSRPEDDIQRFFNILTRSSYASYDLATDQDANADLRTFAQSEFDLVARKWCLSNPWPGGPLFDGVISRANGLFIFIKTVVLALEHCEDPTESLTVTLQDSTGTGLKSLYALYSSILKARIVHSRAEFRQIIGVLLTTAPYRPLCEETIAELAGVRPNLVKKWVNDLSSLLYRDEGASGGIRVRHLSISDFFVNDHCPYQVNLEDANSQLVISCFKTMVNHLSFNICKLEDSRLANADIKDLQSRIQENISDPLQYSVLYWSNHLCFTPDIGNRHVWEHLKEFFEGLYPLFWIEVLSIMGMVPIGAPSLRRVISWAKDAGPTILERIQDHCRFVITFHTPISISTPHVYISTRPFLPSQSPLSPIFGTRFTKAIKVQSGKLLSWPAPPLQWIGHTDAVTCMSYSPDGCRIVSGSNDQTIRIWDAETGVVVGKPLKGHIGSVKSVAYSPDGRRIISGSNDGTIRIWDAETADAVGDPLEGHSGSVKSVAYSPNGWYIISGSGDKTIRIWDAETGAAAGSPLEGHTLSVKAVAYSPDGQYIASGSSDRTIRIWDAETGAAVGKPLEGHTDYVRSIAYSPDGRHITSGSDDRTIRIWDAETGAIVGNPLVGHTWSVKSVAYSPDGRYIVSGSEDRTIRIWDAETGAAAGNPLRGHTDYVWSVAYSPDGRYVISGSGDRSIRIWEAETGAAVGNSYNGHSDYVRAVACSPNGQRIISGSGDWTIQIWDSETGAAISNPLKGHTHSVRCVAYSPNGQQFISGSDDRTIRIWDGETGAAVGHPLEGHTEGVKSVAYSPDGQYIISGSGDRTIRIWDAETGAAVGKPLEGHTDYVQSVAYSPDGQHIVSGSDDRTIRIWGAETGVSIGNPLEGHTNYVRSVAYSPDGRCIISGSGDTTIRIWGAETGAAAGNPLRGHDDYVWSVAYSPDGKRIISGSDDWSIRVWDAKTGAAIGNSLKGHTDYVRTVAFSPDGRHIISGSDDRTIRIWDAKSSAGGGLLEGHTRSVWPIAYSRDGQHIVPGSSDNSVNIDVRDAFPHLSNRLSCSPMHSEFFACPDSDGWVRDLMGGLLYWVPLDCHIGLHSPALLTIPATFHTRSVSLDFEDFAFGTSWTQIFNRPQPLPF